MTDEKILTKEEKLAELKRLEEEKAAKIKILTKEMLLSNGVAGQLEVIGKRIQASTEDVRVSFFGGSDEVGMLLNAEMAHSMVLFILKKYKAAKCNTEQEIKNLN